MSRRDPGEVIAFIGCHVCSETLASAIRCAARYAYLAMVAIGIGGCSSGSNAIVQSFQHAIKRGGGGGIDHVKLEPKYSFLRVTTANSTAILALDRLDPHPDAPIQVWHSAGGEVIRIQNGRVVGAIGLLTEWREVRLPRLPSWSQIAASREPVQWIRMRDVMPGYRFAVRDELIVRAVSPPRTSALRVVDPNTLTWFEERVGRSAFMSTVAGRPATDALPPARYAVEISGGIEDILYGEQCLAPQLCLTWQRWSSELQEANRQNTTPAK